MDQEFYQELQDDVVELLNEFGREVTLRSYTPGGGGKYDPSKGGAATNGQTPYVDTTRIGVLVDAPLNRVGPQYGQKIKEGTLISDDNKWLYLEASGSAPRMQDHVIVDGKQYKIDNIQTLNPAGIPLLYTIVLVA